MGEKKNSPFHPILRGRNHEKKSLSHNWTERTFARAGNSTFQGKEDAFLLEFEKGVREKRDASQVALGFEKERGEGRLERKKTPCGASGGCFILPTYATGERLEKRKKAGRPRGQKEKRRKAGISGNTDDFISLKKKKGER